MFMRQKFSLAGGILKSGVRGKRYDYNSATATVVGQLKQGFWLDRIIRGVKHYDIKLLVLIATAPAVRKD